MNLTFRFFATFREAVGQKSIDRSFDEESITVGHALASLEDEFEGLSGQLIDEAGDIRPQLSVLRNGREVLHQDGVETKLDNGDTISIFPPVAGG